MEERNIRKQNVSERKEKEREQALLTAIKERGIQLCGKGEEYYLLQTVATDLSIISQKNCYMISCKDK
jgi:hypothetical protein